MNSHRHTFGFHTLVAFSALALVLFLVWSSSYLSAYIRLLPQAFNFSAQKSEAASSDNVSGFAWSENVGWVQFNCTSATSTDCGTSTFGVKIDPVSGNLSGYAWSEVAGWISFNASDVIGCPSGTCQPNVANGVFTGWARAMATSTYTSGSAITSQVFSTPTAGVPYIVPTGVTSITVKAWGAGGGGANGSGGAGGSGGGGGFAQATIAVTPGETLTILVGGGGDVVAIGEVGGGGGGYSGVRRSGTNLLIAGGGGGGGGAQSTAGGAGGPGGGSSGVAGSNATNSGGGAGTTSSGGAGSAPEGTASYGLAGSSLVGGQGGNGQGNGVGTGSGGAGGLNGGAAGGGNGRRGGGGGGGGRFGGGGAGGGDGSGGVGGGGGGSSLALGVGGNILTLEVAGSGRVAGNSADSDYSGNAGQGGLGSTGTAATAGNPGRVVVSYSSASPSTQQFNSPTTGTSYTVPSGVTTLRVKAWGAGGGGSNVYVGAGGGFSQADIPVTPGENLTVRVGGPGTNGRCCFNEPGGAGGINGGGNGAGASQGGTAGGGGGYSGLFRGSTELLVAGGGAGSGGDQNGSSCAGCYGGAGGGLSGVQGPSPSAGAPGTQNSGFASLLGQSGWGGGGGGHFGGYIMSGGSGYTTGTNVSNIAGSGQLAANTGGSDYNGTAGRGGDAYTNNAAPGLVVVIPIISASTSPSGWDGWISLNCLNSGACGTSNYGLSLSGSNIRGFAWGGDVIGWLQFNCADSVSTNCSTSNFSVTVTSSIPTIASFTATSPIAYNSNTQLDWSVTNASACSGSGGWSGSKATSTGTQSVGPLIVDTSFTLTCTNQFGTSTQARVVTVNPAPDFTLSSSNNVKKANIQINSTPTTITVVPISGYNNAVTLSVTPSSLGGVPVAYVLSDTSLTSGEYGTGSSIYITSTSTIPAGRYTITVSGTDGTKIHTTNFYLDSSSTTRRIEEF